MMLHRVPDYIAMHCCRYQSDIKFLDYCHAGDARSDVEARDSAVPLPAQIHTQKQSWHNLVEFPLDGPDEAARPEILDLAVGGTHRLCDSLGH